MKTLTYLAKVENGVMSFVAPGRDQVMQDVRMLEGKRVEVIIKALPKRSIKQNAYYWGVVVSMVRDGLKGLGHSVTNEDTHVFLKEKFNGKDIASIDGEWIGRIGASTAELNKPEFIEYIEQIQQFAAQYLGVVIPDPNEQMEIF